MRRVVTAALRTEAPLAVTMGINPLHQQEPFLTSATSPLRLSPPW